MKWHIYYSVYFIFWLFANYFVISIFYLEYICKQNIKQKIKPSDQMGNS